MLVVVIISGIVVTFAVISLSSADGSRYAQLDAERFSARIIDICQQGLLLNDIRAVSIVEDTFTAMRPVEGEWVPFEAFFEPSEAVRWELELDGDLWVPPEVPGPVLWCDGTGEWSPFRLHLIARDQSAHYQIEVDAVGDLQVEQLALQ
ncbi:MAG: hypothetical protein DHS20C11_09410 [Lysobacteraceae bacterium]|nr:MAG: hypothetical protein DHS20C11_09410 [Xanthomonadaceae bacterium]